MSINYVNQFTVQYSTNVSLLLQEQGYKLRGKVMQGSHTGEGASPVNQVGAVSMRDVENRGTPKVITNAAHTRRWVYPIDKILDQQIDKFDTLKTIVDVKSPYAMNASMAAGRAMDDIVIDAAFADAKTGKTGTGTETFNTTASTSGGASVVVGFGASADVGLTVAKLIEAKRVMRKNFVDWEAEEKTVVIGSAQEANLLNQVEVVNTDYSGRPTLVDGNISKFMGWNFLISERLDTPTAADERACIAFVKSGIHLGVWEEVKSDAHQRFDLEANPWELTTTMSVGATRLEQFKVVRIVCQE